MKKEHQRLFVKCWNKEYEATVMCNRLNERIEQLRLLEQPSLRAENSLEHWSEKQSKACEPLFELIKDSSIGEDAAVICSEQLTDIGGYVTDCYHELWMDLAPAKEEEETEDENQLSRPAMRM
jgi:hypothetical protein